jgi:signal transduction histidine kinase
MRAVLLAHFNEAPDPACPSMIFHQREIEIKRGSDVGLVLIQSSLSFDEKTRCITVHCTALSVDSLKEERDRRIEAELAAKEAKAAGAAAIAAIAMVSHELRNTTQGISMTVSMMMSDNTSFAELRELAAACNRQIEHLRRALNGAIELSALVGDPDLEVELKPVNIRKVICDIVYGSKDYAASTGVALTATVEAQTFNHYAMTHEASVVSSLNNLIANAVRFTPEGGSITVGLEADDDADDGLDGGGVRIIVSVTGSGIPEDLHS